MYNKQQFIEHFHDLALNEMAEIMPKNEKAFLENWFNVRYDEYVKWHKENDKRVYLESLTLEQLSRL